MHGDAVPERGVHTPGVRPSTPASVRVVVTSLVALFATSSARAQLDCPSPGFGPLEVTPADGAPLVTRDAYVLVRYSDGYFAEDGEVPVETIFLETDLGVDVPGEVQRVGDAQLFFVPDAPLAPSTNYFGIATGPDGDFEFGFRTGTTFDEAAPQIVEGNDDRSFEVRTGRIEPSCEAPDGGIRVGLSVTRASDDGPAGSVEYHLYLTRAPELTAPRLVARARNFTSAETMTPRVRLAEHRERDLRLRLARRHRRCRPRHPVGRTRVLRPDRRIDLPRTVHAVGRPTCSGCRTVGARGLRRLFGAVGPSRR